MSIRWIPAARRKGIQEGFTQELADHVPAMCAHDFAKAGLAGGEGPTARWPDS